MTSSLRAVVASVAVSLSLVLASSAAFAGEKGASDQHAKATGMGEARRQQPQQGDTSNQPQTDKRGPQSAPGQERAAQPRG